MSGYRKVIVAHQIAEYLDCDYDRAWQVVTCIEKSGFDDMRDVQERGPGIRHARLQVPRLPPLAPHAPGAGR